MDWMYGPVQDVTCLLPCDSSLWLKIESVVKKIEVEMDFN